jgi:serine/threonine protein kinase
MPSPSTTEDLLSLLDKSRLLESVDFGDYLRRRGQSVAIPRRAAELAEIFVSDGLLTRFQADNLLQGKWLGYFVGPYKVLEVLGAGSSGIVYLCEHAQLRRRVAVKVLQGAKARDRKSLERFYREARAAATLDHPNVVRAFDVGQGERFHYLVMEYVDGLNLRQIVKNDGPLNATLAADYLRQAALGLHHAHQSGLVHRDLKPTNLMVGRDGVIKILDLGLALCFEDEGDVLTQGAVLGNVDFIAPEQALDSHSVDIRADIYALGATFWYCLTGSRITRTVVEPSRRLASRSGPTPERPDVPAGLWDVLRKMMARNPADRYQTPSEVVEAVAPWAPDEATRLLLIETPAAEPTGETAVLQTVIETVPEQPAAPATPASQPAATPSPAVTAKTRPPLRHTLPGIKFRPWLLAALLSGLAFLGVAVAWKRPSRTDVPGRGPRAKPFFQPVTPHSP